MSRLTRSINFFESLERDSALLSGSKLSMIQVLFEALCASLSAAQGHSAQRATERKLQALSRAQRILKGLQLTLDDNDQVTLGADLAALYAYMSARLCDASFHQDAQAIDEVLSLARTLAQAWQTLSKPVKMQFDFAGLGGDQTRSSVSYLA
jgi:flagellar protein FliS